METTPVKPHPCENESLQKPLGQGM